MSGAPRAWPEGVEAGADGAPRITADWLREPHLQALLEALAAADGKLAAAGAAHAAAEGGGSPARHEALVVGGAVRNTLLGVPVRDIDVATSRAPEEAGRIAEALGHRVVPTGIRHGTITVVTPAGPYEVTTFRADVETDGRHARVAFTQDMRGDAERRDFTINALYARADGRVVDPVGGLPDIATRTLRFIGDADARIVEDYLRILRFFRFHAHYGRGRPDAEGLRACARHKGGLARLSVERVWSELRRLLEAPEPGMTLLWMRTTGILTAILPESEKWGIDAIPALVGAERDLGWRPDPMLRLMAMLPPDAERMQALAERLKMSKAEAERLVGWARTTAPRAELSGGGLAKRLYRDGERPVLDRLRLALASARGRGDLHDAGGFGELIAFAEGWRRPTFPLKGRDLIAAGMAPGPEVGERLKALEDAWVEGGFAPDRHALIASASSASAGGQG